MAVADRHGLPVAICVESATPHEVKLATNTLVQMVIPDAPQNLVGDNAYDSDKLDSERHRPRDVCRDRVVAGNNRASGVLDSSAARDED